MSAEAPPITPKEIAGNWIAVAGLIFAVMAFVVWPFGLIAAACGGIAHRIAPRSWGLSVFVASLVVTGISMFCVGSTIIRPLLEDLDLVETGTE